MTTTKQFPRTDGVQLVRHAWQGDGYIVREMVDEGTGEHFFRLIDTVPWGERWLGDFSTEDDALKAKDVDTQRPFDAILAEMEQNNREVSIHAPHEVMLDGCFRPNQLEAIVWKMRNEANNSEGA